MHGIKKIQYIYGFFLQFFQYVLLNVSLITPTCHQPKLLQ